MGHRLLFALAMLSLGLAVPSAAQAGKRRTFDLATFTPPAGWSEQLQDGLAGYSYMNEERTHYCQLIFFKSVASTGDARADFDKDWREVIAAKYNVTGKVKPLRRPKLEGWTVNAGTARAKLVDHEADVSLTTYSGHGAVVSIVTVGNDKRCARAAKGVLASLKLEGAAEAAHAGAVAVKVDDDTARAPAGSAPGADGRFAFDRSTFDDGWVASIEADWVKVEKGDVTVYLYFVVPYDSSIFSGTGVIDRDYYWDNYVAKQFRINSKEYRDDGEVVAALRPPYVEGAGVDRQSGKRRFVAMHLGISPNAAMLTVASAPDEAALRRAFPKANDRWASDLAAMSRYNKFAVGAKDLVGTWQSGGSQTLQWYDARTGAYAGATFAASSATFTFAADGSYRSVHNGATGAVGAMNTFQQTYKGTYRVANWSVTATKRFEGRTDTFDAHLQVVRGGRLLFLDDQRGGSYLLVRTAN